MPAIARNLDHLGTAVADLNAGKAAFEKLGFNMTSRSQHRGAISPGGPVELFGQGNHCAMLKQGYLEVLGIFDRALPTPAQQYLDKYEGLHIIGLEPASADAVRALITNGAPLDAPRELGREVDFGPTMLERRRVEFLNIKFRASAFDEATFIYTQHLTRDTMWQPHLLTHPNKAHALDRVYLCSLDPARTADRLAPVLGVAPTSIGKGELEFRFESSALCVLSPQAWQQAFAGAAAPGVSRPVGFAVRTSSVEAVTELLDKNRVAYNRSNSGGVFVAPAFACGNVIHFTEGPEK